MIDYYKTKAHPITQKMILDGYTKVRKNGSAAGVDGVRMDDFRKNLNGNLYKLWNRMTSGSYYPKAVREKKIEKGNGKFRSLGIPCVEDRVAQSVVKGFLEPKVEPTFHPDSFGYRNSRQAHDAIRKARQRCNIKNWVLDIDIKSFFDTIDHDLLMKAVKRYTEEKWVLMYIERWLKGGLLQEDGKYIEKEQGSIQGSVISPLLSNIFMHFVFDKWMEKNHADVPFERYCDDILVHCENMNQALSMKRKISDRLKACKLELNEEKTKIVFCKKPTNTTTKTYPAVSFDFLGYTFKPRMCKTKKGIELLTQPCMSTKAKKRVGGVMRELNIHSINGNLQYVAKAINTKARGWIQYYCEFSKWTTYGLWDRLNFKITKWVTHNKGWGLRRAWRYLRYVYKRKPMMFAHWQIAHP